MAFVDARQLPADHAVEADVCIVGAGAAGLALADALGGGSRRIVLLESGGLEYDARTQALYDGVATGRSYPVQASRLRYFGGSTNHWGGNVRPLDRIDMEPRPWVPHSGWPMRREELDPYYERALSFLGLRGDAFTVETWIDGESCRPWAFEEDGVVNEVFPVVSDERRLFGQTQRERIRQASNLDVYLFANALELETDDPPRHVQRLRAGTLDGQRFEVRARSFVLATGGIENARLLLLSSSVNPAGVGNDHDLVGRFFADHIVLPAGGDLYPSDQERSAEFYRVRESNAAIGRGFFRLPDRAQRDLRLQNLRVELAAPLPLDHAMRRVEGFRSLRETWLALQEGTLPPDFERHVANMIADVDDLVLSGYHYARYAPDYPAHHVNLIVVAEPAPNPDSRVQLDDARDALGQRRVRVDWKLSSSDGDSVQRSLDVLAREFGLAGIGRLRHLVPDDGFASVSPSTHSHHMGTTRMHDDPAQGVVDASCRVHGIANLYVAGSSVFPTYGQVNPTLTILALAFRLGDHLREAHA